MLKQALLAAVCATALAAPAKAQSTASQVVPGYWTTTPQPNCTGTQCFVQYGPEGPSGGGNTSANLNANFTNTPIVTASSYTANYAIGGLQTAPLFRTIAQPSGLLDALSVASKGGVTSGIAIYGFTKSPASTCTDHAAFVLSSADLPYLIPGFPVTLTPAATVGTTQTTASAGAGQIPVSIHNQDTAPTLNAYFCAVVVGAPTPGSTTDLVFDYALIQD